MQDLFDPGILRQKLDLALREKNQVLTKVYNRRGIDAEAVTKQYLGYAERLGRYVADTGLVLNEALDNGLVVLLEGAQATLLDVDHGTYPFVTSSSPTAGGACAGSGIGPDPDHQSRRHTEGVHHQGRGRPVSDRADRRARRVAAQDRRRVRRRRPAGRDGRAGSTRSSPGTQPGSTDLPTTSSPNSTSCPGWRRCRFAWRTTCTASGTRDADDADRLPPRHPGL